MLTYLLIIRTEDSFSLCAKNLKKVKNKAKSPESEKAYNQVEQRT